MNKLIYLILFLSTQLSYAEEINIPTLREPTHGTLLEDFYSRLTAKEVAYFGENPSNSLVTSGHELNHCLNNNARNLIRKPQVNAFYTSGGRAYIFHEPPLRLSDIAAAIPKPLRDEFYDLYLIKSQKDWENQPLYVYDEFSAYITGSITAKEYKLRDLSSTKNGYKMAYFCVHLLKLIKDKRIRYDEFSDLKDFTVLQIRRLDAVADKEQKSYFRVDLTQDKILLQWAKEEFGYDIFENEVPVISFAE